MLMNRFFASALRQASGAAGKRSRLLSLLGQFAVKLRGTRWNDLKAVSIKEKFFVFGRLLKAYSLGRYREVPWKTLLLVVAAIIYFVNPLDLVPDLVPLTGLTDDFAVLIWVYNSVSDEIEKFLAWEQSQYNKSGA
jgi:uncharacterized membrane protein YkvA (DUF1232 family)